MTIANRIDPVTSNKLAEFRHNAMLATPSKSIERAKDYVAHRFSTDPAMPDALKVLDKAWLSLRFRVESGK